MQHDLGIRTDITKMNQANDDPPATGLAPVGPRLLHYFYTLQSPIRHLSRDAYAPGFFVLPRDKLGSGVQISKLADICQF